MKVHAFTTGTHTAMNGKTLEFSAAVVQQIAESYDVSKHEAPFVIGHPKTDDPAFGWVKSVSFADGKLMVEDGDDTEPAFAELVQAGRYKKVSASFYTPDHPSNPVPGGFYLKHVGFLGATPPAVKGLSAVQFADGEDDGVVTVEFSEPAAKGPVGAFRELRNWLTKTFGVDATDKALPADAMASFSDDDATAGEVPAAPVAPAVPNFSEPPKESTVTKEQAEALEKQNAELKAANEKQAAEFAEFKEAQAKTAKAARQAEIVAFAAALVKAGKLPYKDQAREVAFMEALPIDAELCFAEGDKEIKTTALAHYQGRLAAMKTIVEFGEFARDEDAPKPPASDAQARVAADYGHLVGSKK